MARFALHSNGKKIESLDDLRDNFSIHEMLDYFRNGKLEHWLQENSFLNELSQISEIKKEASDQTATFKLFTIFSLSDEQMETANQKQEHWLVAEKDLLEQKERETSREKSSKKVIVTNEDLELFWDDTEVGIPRLEGTFGGFDSELFDVLKEKFISVDKSLYCCTDEHLYESNDGITFSEIPEPTTILNETHHDFIYTIQELNGKLFLPVCEVSAITPDDVETFVQNGLSFKQDDLNNIRNRSVIIESNSNRSAWTIKQTQNGSPTWGITETDTGFSFLNLRPADGYHDHASKFPLSSTQDIEYLSYFKGNYIAAGHWYSLDKNDVYSIYASSDRKHFEPVTPPEAQFHRAEIIKLKSFENIAFVTAYPSPLHWSLSTEDSQKQHILPETKTFYSVDGQTWHLSTIKAHQIFKTDFGFMAYSIEYGTSKQAFDKVYEAGVIGFNEGTCRGFSNYHIHHLYVSVDGIAWKELPLPSAYLKFILPFGDKFLFFSGTFFNVHTGQYHENCSCFYGEIKAKNKNNDFLKPFNQNMDVIDIPSDLRYNMNRKPLVSVGQSVKKGEKLFSYKSGWFSKKYYESPFDCTILYIFEDVWKNPEGFIVSKNERMH